MYHLSEGDAPLVAVGYVVCFAESGENDYFSNQSLDIFFISTDWTRLQKSLSQPIQRVSGKNLNSIWT